MQTPGKTHQQGIRMGSNSKPFLSQDVFRLVVRLEAQKVLGEVDVGALERKFRVPLGYSEEGTHHKQEKLDLENLPGPGAYDVDDPWKLDDLTPQHQSAIFASRTDRDPFQLASLIQINNGASSLIMFPLSKAPNQSANNNNSSSNELYSPIQTSQYHPPPLGSFTRSTRGLEPATSAARRTWTRQQQTLEAFLLNQEQNGGSHAFLQSHTPPVRSLLSTQSAVFPRVSKDKTSFIPASTTDSDLGPGIYDVRRFWDAKSPVDSGDPLQHHHRHQTSSRKILRDSPSSAAFGASREKREVMWSLARNLPSYAVPEAWNASPHYAKQKTKVLHAVEKDKKRKEKQTQLTMTVKINKGLEDSKSAPRLSSLKHASRFPATYSSTTSNESLDPFEWLRRQPQGEHRVNLLATKYGLLEQVKTPQHHSHAELTSLQQSPQQPPACDEVTGSKRLALAHQGSLQDLQHQNDNTDSNGDQGAPSSSIDLPHSNKRDERIVVSCRLPGGMMLSATLFSRKKVRHLKASIVQKSCKRFTHEEQFDVYLPNGRKLGHLEDTLHACGLTTRSLVQIVPATNIPATTATAGSPSTSKLTSAKVIQE